MKELNDVEIAQVSGAGLFNLQGWGLNNDKIAHPIYTRPDPIIPLSSSQNGIRNRGASEKLLPLELI